MVKTPFSSAQQARQYSNKYGNFRFLHVKANKTFYIFRLMKTRNISYNYAYGFTPGISPYTYTADNPVMLTDPDGMYFTGKNLRKAIRYLRRIERKIKRIYKKIQRSKNNKQIEKLKIRVRELGKSMKDILDIMNDEMVEYRFSHSKTSVSGLTKENGKWIFTMSANGMANIIHEIKHGGRIARREYNPLTGWRYGVNDEVEAYKAQWARKGEITGIFAPNLEYINALKDTKIEIT